MLDRDPASNDKRFARRAVILGGLQVAGFGLLGWRLFNLQVVDAARYAPLAEENRVNFQFQAPKRGRILDRNGVPLADNEETFRATLTPALASDVPAVLTLFRRIVPIPADEAEKIAKRAKKQSRSTSIVIANDLSFDDVAKINLNAPQLPGIRTEVAWRRKYREGPATGHIVGYVGSVEKLGIDDDAVLRLPGMKIGKIGVEAGLETELRGRGGAQKLEIDAHGHPVRSLGSVDPVAGTDVTLTIDKDLQSRVLERLQNERRAACVVLETATGRIMAMASAPAYDPGVVADGLSDADWQKLMTAEDKPLLNRAIGGQYPPGSTFKIVTALAALKAGLVDTKEHIECSGKFELADQAYRCWKRSGHGPVAFHDAVRSSCDVYFFELAQRLGIERIAATARELGLGQTYDFGLPQQKAGIVPDADWKRGRWNAGWLGGDTILAGIGQGYVLANPLQLAVMIARVATGTAVEPVLVQSPLKLTAPAKLTFADEHLNILRTSLTAVVNEEGGTGAKANLGEGRPLVAGKTGTSQVTRQSSDTSENDLEWGQRDHALFVGYTPADAPRYAISVVIEHGGGGGAAAAPLAKDILTMILDDEARATGAGDVPQDGTPQTAVPKG